MNIQIDNNIIFILAIIAGALGAYLLIKCKPKKSDLLASSFLTIGIVLISLILFLVSMQPATIKAMVLFVFGIIGALLIGMIIYVLDYSKIGNFVAWGLLIFTISMEIGFLYIFMHNPILVC